MLGSSSIFMEQPGRLEVQVEKILPHPFYDEASLDNDIALIKLSSRVPFSGTIHPVCLNAERNETSIFKRCYAAGWGLTSPQGEKINTAPLKGQVYKTNIKKVQMLTSCYGSLKILFNSLEII